QVGAIIVGMKVDFYRYHLPLVLGISILCGIGFQYIWQLLANRGWAAVWSVIPGVTVDQIPSSRATSRLPRSVERDEPDPEASVSRPIRSGTP
ncbi:MAG TPA: hypothetical protein VD789_03650, partial [Thermomicrobiales bacterium]|nr:hypothetical protein [Thermomicrobiales bacterium]